MSAPTSTAPRPGYADQFGIDNIPFGVASSSQHPQPQCVSRFRDSVLFLGELSSIFSGIDGLPDGCFTSSALNDFAALPQATHLAVHERLQSVIREDESLAQLPSAAVEPISAVSMHMPVVCGDFTDFSCSTVHMENMALAMLGKRLVAPNFYHAPLGYAGRCSSLEVSGTPVERPWGQYWSGKPMESAVAFGPSLKMDFELELACIVGRPIPRRERVTASQAEQHIFGYVLLNDWSARDIQSFEMNPLGPLNSKNAATTISPWVVTAEAAKAFKTSSPARAHGGGDAPYLAEAEPNNLKVALQVTLQTAADEAPRTFCRSDTGAMYFTLAQCVAHQAVGGAGLKTGDICATGTVSAVGDGAHGCLAELMTFDDPSALEFLEDGTTVNLTGVFADGIGFGECMATLMPAKPF